jgi:threonine/homoserine/homoserine lactone efflux protein
MNAEAIATPIPELATDTKPQGLSTMGAFRNGFFTNALNPKTTLFVVSVYTQVVHADTPIGIQIGYGLFMSVAHGMWFSLVARPGWLSRHSNYSCGFNFSRSFS